LIQTSPHRRYPGTMIYKPEFANQARAMCRLGATDEELAEHFGACVRTIYRWRNTHEEFAEAVVVGKDHADARVERALYSRAVGCTVERTKVFKSAGDPDPVYATYKHQLPPDATAALHWLRVRQPEKWRIRDEPEEEDELGDIILQAFARVGKLDRLTEDEGQSDPVPPHRPEQPSPPHPTPPPEAAAPHPDPDTPPVDDKAPQPRLCPQDDTGPAPDADLAPPPVPVPPDPKPRPKPPLATAPEPAPPPFPVLNFSPRGYG
jgi:transposase-like protein